PAAYCPGARRPLHSVPTRRSSDLVEPEEETTALYEAIRTRQLGPAADGPQTGPALPRAGAAAARGPRHNLPAESTPFVGREEELDRKSTRLNSSHVKISYAVFCLK